MVNKLILITLCFVLVVLIDFRNQLKDLTKTVNSLEFKNLSKEEIEFQTAVIAKEMKGKSDSVLSIRCSDSNSKKIKRWNGTASKVSENLILTAEHIFSNNGIDENHKDEKGEKEVPKEFPIFCNLYSKGKKVGTYSSEKNEMRQIGLQDLAIAKVEFNNEGLDLESLDPEVQKVDVGDRLVLITHPKNFINDNIITFGVVLNDDTSKLLESKRKEYWKNTILTDMTASHGSSGSPLFTFKGELIGIHVGGVRESFNANYQIVFDRDFAKIYKDMKKEK